MPATSKAMQRFMGLCKSNPEKARGECPPPDVAAEFAKAPGGTVKGLPEKVARDRSTRGSPAFSPGELAQGFRRVGTGT